jgi:hypothetical protein
MVEEIKRREESTHRVGSLYVCASVYEQLADVCVSLRSRNKQCSVVAVLFKYECALFRVCA